VVFFDIGASVEEPKEISLTYDLVIIGAGPAGLSAGVYASRGGMKTLIVEKASEGGQIVLTKDIENYPGFVSVSGDELARKFIDHAKHFGCEFISAGVVNFEVCCDEKKVVFDDGKIISAKYIIIATGAKHRKLNVSGENDFNGKGVSYCAICDGAFFKNKHVAVVGGGNSAIEEALYLSQIASKVTVIHRRDELRADKIIQERAFANSKIDFVWDSVVTEMVGGKVLERLILKNKKTNNVSNLDVDGVFIYVGIEPKTELFSGLLKLSPTGFIEVDKNMETSIPGIFAAGDVIDKEIRQIINAASDGAIAASIIAKRQ